MYVVFKRCISDLPSSECPLITNRNKYLKRLRRSVSDNHSSDDTDTNKTVDIWEPKIPMQPLLQLPQAEELRQEDMNDKKCAENRRLGRVLIEDKVEKTDTYLGRFVGNLVLHMTNATHIQEAQQVGHFTLT